jgi:hypothetical protein
MVDAHSVLAAQKYDLIWKEKKKARRDHHFGRVEWLRRIDDAHLRVANTANGKTSKVNPLKKLGVLRDRPLTVERGKITE